jgi:hypothetical protein
MITKIIETDEALRPYIHGSVSSKEMILPIFYNQIDSGWLREHVSADKMFNVEGDEKGVNYSRS